MTARREGTEVKGSSRLVRQSVSDGLQRQAERLTPVLPPARPVTPGDWVTVVRAQAESAQGRLLDSRQVAQFTGLQRQVAQTLAQRYRTDRQLPDLRIAQYAGHLATLQRHELSAPVTRATLNLLHAGSETCSLLSALERFLGSGQNSTPPQNVVEHDVSRDVLAPLSGGLGGEIGSSWPLPAKEQDVLAGWAVLMGHMATQMREPSEFWRVQRFTQAEDVRGHHPAHRHQGARGLEVTARLPVQTRR